MTLSLKRAIPTKNMVYCLIAVSVIGLIGYGTLTKIHKDTVRVLREIPSGREELASYRDHLETMQAMVNLMSWEEYRTLEKERLYREHAIIDKACKIIEKLDSMGQLGED